MENTSEQGVRKVKELDIALHLVVIKKIVAEGNVYRFKITSVTTTNY